MLNKFYSDGITATAFRMPYTFVNLLQDTSISQQLYEHRSLIVNSILFCDIH